MNVIYETVNIKAGDVIVFKLNHWNSKGARSLKRVRAVVNKIIKDPLGKHESTCSVSVGGNDYGIPKSRIVKHISMGQMCLPFKNETE